MTKSKAIWAVVLLFILLMIYSWRWTPFGDFYEKELPPIYGWTALLVCLLSALAIGGLVTEKPWSAYLVYGMGLWIIGQWLYFIWSLNGLELPYQDTLSNVLGFLPGIVLIATCLFAIVAVRRHFRRLAATN